MSNFRTILNIYQKCMKHRHWVNCWWKYSCEMIEEWFGFGENFDWISVILKVFLINICQDWQIIGVGWRWANWKIIWSRIIYICYINYSELPPNSRYLYFLQPHYPLSSPSWNSTSSISISPCLSSPQLIVWVTFTWILSHIDLLKQSIDDQA